MKRSAIVLALFLTGCATAPSSPYRVPQATFPGNATEQVKLVAVQKCVANGGVVEQNTTSQLICSIPMDDSFKSMMFRAMATPKYSTRPNLKARYSFVNTGTQTYVAIDTYMEYQNAFGQLTVIPVKNNEVATKAQAMLDGIKTSVDGQPGAAPESAPRPNCKACKAIGG